VPITVRGEPVNDNDAAARERIAREAETVQVGVAVMAVAVVVLVVTAIVVLGGWWAR
jgi:hypothetical protein